MRTLTMLVFILVAMVLCNGSATAEEGVLVQVTTMSDVQPLNADGLNPDGTPWHATSYQSIIEIAVGERAITVSVVHPSLSTPPLLGAVGNRFPAIIPAEDYQRITSGTGNTWIRAEVIKIQGKTQ